MTETERRRARRQDVTVPVSLSITEPVDINGETVNFSNRGVLLLVRGRFSVTLGLKEKTYRGRLVRVLPIDSSTTACAIELEEVLQEPTQKWMRETLLPPPEDHQAEGTDRSSDEGRRLRKEEPYLTTEEAAAYLQINVRTLYRLLRVGEIPAGRIGRLWRFRESELDAWLGTNAGLKHSSVRRSLSR